MDESKSKHELGEDEAQKGNLELGNNYDTNQHRYYGVDLKEKEARIFIDGFVKRHLLEIDERHVLTNES